MNLWHYPKKPSWVLCIPTLPLHTESTETAARSPISPDRCCTPGEGNGNPLQYSCLENPMDQGAWWATIHVVVKSRTRLSDFCVCVCVPPGGDCGSATGEASFWIRIMSGPAHPAGAWTTQEGKKCTLAHGVHSVCEKQSSHHLCFNIWPWRRESGWYNDETS